jgi:hypothetical protein
LLANQRDAVLKPEDGAGPVLDELAKQPDQQANLPTLAKQTNFDGDFVKLVLDQLNSAGMVEPAGEADFKLTSFGAKARFLVKR